MYTKQSKPNIYQSKHSIEHIIEMIKYANLRMKVVLNTVVTKFNYTKIDEMIEFAKSTHIPRLKIIRLHNVDSRGFNDKNVEDDLKTDQKEGEWYYYFYSRYIAQAVEVVNNRFKGRTDAIFEDGFTIRFDNAGNWQNVYAHIWERKNNVDTALTGDWPGAKLQKDKNGDYVWKGTWDSSY